MNPFFLTIPHSGEVVPAEAEWLKGFSEVVLFRDVDRFVDKLYAPAIAVLKLPVIVADFHRYAVDLNRIPDDVDQDSVEGSQNPSGTFPLGFHWVQTTYGELLMKQPISQELHQLLRTRYYQPFHDRVQAEFTRFRAAGFNAIFHLDAHSMPSKGTAAHRDSGAERPQIVISDQDGTSCMTEYSDLVRRSYEATGFKVSYNWPYKGGRITQVYGKPALGQHTLQVEMNRSLYMNEDTKQLLPEKAAAVQKQVSEALRLVVEGIASLSKL